MPFNTQDHKGTSRKSQVTGNEAHLELRSCFGHVLHLVTELLHDEVLHLELRGLIHGLLQVVHGAKVVQLENLHNSSTREGFLLHGNIAQLTSIHTPHQRT